MEKKYWQIGGNYRGFKSIIILIETVIASFILSFLLFGQWFHFPFWVCIIIGFVCFFLFSSFTFSGLVDIQPFWELNENYLTYYHCNKLIDQIYMWFKKSAYSFRLKVDEIDTIMIYSTASDLFAYGNKMHNVLFKITTKDGNQFKMLAIVDHHKEAFIEAVTYLENRSIKIIDKLNVIETLKDPSKYLWTEIEKQKRASK